MMGRLVSTVYIIGIVVLFAFAPFAADAQPEKRVALVIGNSAYQNTAALKNPSNDAEDFAKTIKSLEFQVILEKDLDKRGMEHAFADFARLAEDADVALFYYAGHAMQFGGQNYLMPIDAVLQDEFSVGFEMARVDDVLNSLERARGVKVLVLDACRNNPLAEQLSRRAKNRDYFATRGLARVQHPSGMIVAYATQADQTAEDGQGRNSPFTSALIKRITEPGIEIAQIFRRVAVDVNASTQGRQLPDLSMSLLGEVFLSKPEKPQIAIETEAWEKIARSHDRADFDKFIRDFPDSPFVPVANERIAALETVRQREAEQSLSQAARGGTAPAAENRVAADVPALPQAPLVDAAKDHETQAARVHASTSQSTNTQPGFETDQSVHLQTPQLQARLGPGAQQEKPLEAAPDVEKPAPEKTRPAPTVAAIPPADTVPDSVPKAVFAKEIAHELRRVGCFNGSEGVAWEAGPRAGLKQFLRATRLKVSADEPNAQILSVLKLKSGRVCPLRCPSGEVNVDATCVAKTCSYGSKLSRLGKCTAIPVTEHTRIKVKHDAAPMAEARPRPRVTNSGEPMRPDQRSCTPICAGDTSPCDPLYFKVADGRCSRLH